MILWNITTQKKTRCIILHKHKYPGTKTKCKNILKNIEFIVESNWMTKRISEIKEKVPETKLNHNDFVQKSNGFI